MEPPTRRLNSSLERPVDRQIWNACAGATVNLPPVGSLVYYFPQGHAEQADQSPIQFSNRIYSTPSVRCRVSSVLLLARTDTDEIFAKIRLMPVAADYQAADDNYQLIADEVVSVRSCSKKLTFTDVCGNGGLGLTKQCAEFLPQLNLNAARPSQNLFLSDLQGKVWKFEHSFNKNASAHRFGTTGWMSFVKSKNLILDDSLVFMFDARDTSLHISVRRALYRNNSTVRETDSQLDRRGLGKVSKEEVIEAAELAVAGDEFEIVYYPGVGVLKFVVNADLVERALGFPWRVNLNVKVNVPGQSNPLLNWKAQGTVVAISGYDETGLWDESSPWRKLKIQFVNPLVTIHDVWFSPWELELNNPSDVPGSSQGNDAATGTIRLFGKVISYERKPDGNA